MNERIRKLRKTLDITQQEFADKVKIKRNTVATYELGRSIPSDSAISLICYEFNVNEEWLRTGKGEMFKQLDRKEELTQAIEKFLGNESDTFKERLINILIRLNSSEWKVLEQIAIKIFNDKSNNNEEISATEEEAAVLPSNEKEMTETKEYSDMTLDEIIEQTRILENLAKKKLAERSSAYSAQEDIYKDMV